MKKDTDLIAYREILQIIIENRFKLILFCFAGIFISIFMILLYPKTYQISGLYTTPSRGYINLSGEWIEQPYEKIETTILKFQNKKFSEIEHCKSFINKIFEESVILPINTNIFKIKVTSTNLDCAKMKFDMILSSTKHDLNLNQLKIIDIQNKAFKDLMISNNQKFLKDIFISENLAYSSRAIIPFSEVSLIKIEENQKNWTSILKYVLISLLIIILLYLLWHVIYKASRN